MQSVHARLGLEEPRSHADNDAYKNNFKLKISEEEENEDGENDAQMNDDNLKKKGRSSQNWATRRRGSRPQGGRIYAEIWRSSRERPLTDVGVVRKASYSDDNPNLEDNRAKFFQGGSDKRTHKLVAPAATSSRSARNSAITNFSCRNR